MILKTAKKLFQTVLKNERFDKLIECLLISKWYLG